MRRDRVQGDLAAFSLLSHPSLKLSSSLSLNVEPLSSLETCPACDHWLPNVRERECITMLGCLNSGRKYKYEKKENVKEEEEEEKGVGEDEDDAKEEKERTKKRKIKKEMKEIKKKRKE